MIMSVPFFKPEILVCVFLALKGGEIVSLTVVVQKTNRQAVFLRF